MFDVILNMKKYIQIFDGINISDAKNQLATLS